MFLVALFIFIGGIEPSIALVFEGTVSSFPGIWTSMVAAFIGGMLWKQFTTAKDEWKWKQIITRPEHEFISWLWGGTIMVDHKIRAVPGWIGIAIFALTLIIKADFQFGWNNIRFAFGPAFMAWGAYGLVIQAPWSAYLSYAVIRENTKQSAFLDLVLEARGLDTGIWERIQILPMPFNINTALHKYQELIASKKYSDVRVVEESGKRQIRLTF